MEELKDIQQQKKLLEKQLAELQYKESRLERKEKYGRGNFEASIR